MNDVYTHADRPVNVVLFREAVRDVQQISKSCVMLVAKPDLSESQFRDALQELVRAAPLAIALGSGTAYFFDALIDCVSREPGPLIMTKTLEGELGDAIDEFLVATWPSDDRFDDWMSYTILVLGDDDLADEVRHELRKRNEA